MSNNDKKWASNDKDRLLVENFKKFMKTGDFSPITEAKVKDFILGGEMEKRKYSSIPVYVLQRVLKMNSDIHQQARMAANPKAQMEAFKEIARLMNDFDEDGSIGKVLNGKKLSDVMDINGSLQYAEQKGML